ncbi:hypothetical protein [Nocardia wallacei]|uniref:hypothetical protein n=1 Tax=Nocardia wallacei TaxID=480035 RepID=UPI00245740DD|nr:hypothetical protein [Nocardia wallacei]
MNRDEVISLLMAASLYDDREPSESLIAAWAEAAHRAGWTHQDAIAAVHEHYAHNTDRIMPGHITQLIRAERSRYWEQ